MKLTAVDNASMTIQANVEKEGDYDVAEKIANKIVDSSGDCYVVASSCPYEQWVQVTTVWDNKQAQELKDAYKVAKKEVLAEMKPQARTRKSGLR